MNDYPLMCQTSPVQKEWKPKGGDIAHDSVTNLLVCESDDNKGFYWYFGDDYDPIRWKETKDYIWLPRQEDWQDIWIENAIVGFKGEYLSELTKMYCKISDGKMGIDPFQIKESEAWTLTWCLFIHKEFYGLVWDWEKKIWKPLCPRCKSQNTSINKSDEDLHSESEYIL